MSERGSFLLLNQVPSATRHSRFISFNAWADRLLLKDLHLARRKSEPIRSGELPLGGLGRDYNVVLSAGQAMCHLALFGPPGSGKLATCFMTWLRAWSAAWSAIVLDPKGERRPRNENHAPHPSILKSTTALPITTEPDDKDALVVADYRPTFSFRQLMNLTPETAPPEYDAEQIPLHGDPSFADTLDRAELER